MEKNRQEKPQVTLLKLEIYNILFIFTYFCNNLVNILKTVLTLRVLLLLSSFDNFCLYLQ